MGFFIRYTDADGEHVRELNPPPSDVDYPEAEAVNVSNSVDGNVIIQRPMRDSRMRKWIFQGWGKESEPYATQWAWLSTQTAGKRHTAGLDHRIHIWEDVSGVGGFDRLDGTERLYTRIRLAQVNRVPRSGGGPVRYDSTIEFFIDDPTYESF